jgi:hypothetical protein
MDAVAQTLRVCLTRGLPIPLPVSAHMRLSSLTARAGNNAATDRHGPARPSAHASAHAGGVSGGPQPRPSECVLTRRSKLAVANALRYFPDALHRELAVEFADELRTGENTPRRRLGPCSHAQRATSTCGGSAPPSTPCGPTRSRCRTARPPRIGPLPSHSTRRL